MGKKQMKIAVVGKSASGKSAFIRSFSASSGLIDSVGEGQTTRCYGEYEFLLDGDAVPEAEAQIALKGEFSGRMADRAAEQILKEYWSASSEMDIREWFPQEFRDSIYEERLKEILLGNEAFFRIEEFAFLDAEIVRRAEEEFENFKQNVMKNRAERQKEQGADREEKTAQEKEADQKEWLSENLYGFYEKIYDLIINVLKGRYHDNSFFSGEEKRMCFRLPINEENRKLLSCLLKVGENGNSLTGILSKVRVVSSLNEKYRECIKKSDPDLESVTLIDTYGLDQSEVPDKNVLEKRYDDILNRDYPDISAVFFVVRLTHGAPSDFREALLTLYRTKAEVMAYVVGTHIDESLSGSCDEEGKNWLYCGDKTKFEAPHLRGKIWKELVDNSSLIATLHRQRVPETLARMRCEVMRKRFAPFCGKPEDQAGDIDYESVNVTSVKVLFDSISLQEHMGEGIVSVAKIRNGISTSGIPEEFAGRFIENTKKQFKELYMRTWSKTRGKVRRNLEDYTMGFCGTTVNATWGNAFRRAFYQTFALGSDGESSRKMLSDALGMEGEEKVAFDEIMNKARGEMVCPACCERRLYSDEYNCGSCGEAHKKVELCIWNSFIRAASFEAFGQCPQYPRVIDWLLELHGFPDEEGELKKEIAGKIKTVLADWVILLCEKHNAEVIARNTRA